MKDEDKWPVSQQQTIVVVTRTYQEQQSRRRKKIGIALLIIVFLMAWLFWALKIFLILVENFVSPIDYKISKASF